MRMRNARMHARVHDHAHAAHVVAHELLGAATSWAGDATGEAASAGGGTGDGSAGGGGMDGRVFGEASGGALTFTWSSAHSMLHHAWDANQSHCRLPHPRRYQLLIEPTSFGPYVTILLTSLAPMSSLSGRPCFPLASEAQREWEASVGGGSQRRFA